MWELTILPFFLVFLAEFGDKSQLVTLSFTTEGNSLLTVILGVIVGLGGVTLLGVIGGALLYSYIPLKLIQLGVSITFFGAGIYTLFMIRNKNKKTTPNYEKETIPQSEGITSNQKMKTTGVIKISTTLFLMELGDKTQLLIIGLVVATSFPLIVGFSCFSGLLVGNILVIIFGRSLLEKVSPKSIQYISSILFILFGLLTLLEYFGILSI
ncbi:MAG: TMEM165/GDT1 family protein [Candidatus Ranarchaeia archaeon]